MKKKILLCLLVLIGLLSLTGCGSENKKKEKGPEIMAQDASIYVGVDFDATKYATVEEGVNLEVIRSNVNDKKPGEYTVTYEATDDSGKTSTKTIMVTVDELNQEKVKQELDNIVSSLGLTDYNMKSNAGLGYNVFTNYYLNNKVNDYQTMRMYNNISVAISTVDASDPDLELSKDHYVYRPDFYFNFAFTDRNEKLSERYSLYSLNKSMQISNGEKTITIENGSIGGEKEKPKFEDAYYITHFSYRMEESDIETLKEILSSSNVNVIANTYYEVSEPDRPLNRHEVPKTFEFNLNEEDINSLKAALNLYDEIIKVVGEY